MGGTESKESGRKASSPFSAEEKENIEKSYQRYFHSKDGFLEHSPFSKTLSKKLLDFLTGLDIPESQKPPSAGVPSITQYHSFLALVMKGSCSQKSQVLFSLCKDGKTVTGHSILQTILDLVAVYKYLVSKFPHFRSLSFAQNGEKEDKGICLYWLKDLFSQGALGKGVSDITVPNDFSCQGEDIENWMYKTPSFVNMFDTVFMGVFSIENEKHLMDTLSAISPIPELPEYKNGQIQTILDVNSLIFLNNNLPSVLQCEWRLLFSNSCHGDSFSQLVSHITHKGPSIFIVRDKDGHIFGGFASHSWECKAKFYGESTCFLFTLSPHYGIYTTTTYNENYMYLNQGQETLPNGLGMGGQFNYFGLWIDNSFNNGHSKAKPKNTTYGSPQLSSTPEFEVDVIEVWAVGREPKSESDEEAEEDKPAKSILDRNNESKALLELIGKPQVSEGMRERDDKDEETEEMRKKMNTIPKLL